MSLVIDSSALVALLVDTGPDGTWIEQTIEAKSLYAPDLLQVEATNVLRRLELAGRISSAEANAAREDLLQLDIELIPFPPCAERIWELRYSVSSYDAWYVACAEMLAMPLATLDKRLAAAHGPQCKFVLPAA